MALAEVLRKAGVEQADFLHEGVRVLAQELMEMELAEHIGASATSVVRSGAAIAMGRANEPGMHASAQSSCGCHGYAMAASFRACASRGVAPLR
jgi:hypothetical protein